MDFMLLLGLIALVFIVLEFIIILSVITNNRILGKNKIFWILLILFTQGIGVIIYFIVSDKNILK